MSRLFEAWKKKRPATVRFTLYNTRPVTPWPDDYDHLCFYGEHPMAECPEDCPGFRPDAGNPNGPKRPTKKKEKTL
jgi:hypothetical protein